MNPKYLSCPRICPESENNFDLLRNKFCASCPNGKAREKFREKTLLFWEKRLGKDARRYKFDDVLALLYNVIGFENAPREKISAKTQALLDAYLFEKNKAEAIREFNHEQKK